MDCWRPEASWCMPPVSVPPWGSARNRPAPPAWQLTVEEQYRDRGGDRHGRHDPDAADERTNDEPLGRPVATGLRLSEQADAGTSPSSARP